MADSPAGLVGPRARPTPQDNAAPGRSLRTTRRPFTADRFVDSYWQWMAEPDNLVPVTPPVIVLGPLLRYVDSTRATVWVETDRPCEVRVRCGDVEASASTWGVHGHHYALLDLEGLTPGSATRYMVEADGTAVWPLDGADPSTIRTRGPGDDVRLSFGSCRKAEGEDPDDLAAFGADALTAMAARMGGDVHPDWPDVLLFLGDQVYADEPSQDLRERLKARRAAGEGPAGARTAEGQDEVGEEICDFEEYTWLYHESWAPAKVRWLLSTVPTCMILDDHDLRDDWNSSWSWRQEVTAQPWWRARVVGAFSSYWVYQHLGNLSPDELAADELYRAVRSAGSDAEREQLLADFAWRADSEPGSARWSYHRDFGRTRLLMVDSRCSRRLDPQDRAMIDSAEWAWVREQALGTDVDHLLIGTSLPFLMMPGLHHLEGWNEATAEGAWGRVYSGVAEKIRLAVDLEHWAAFRTSFDAMVQLVADVAARADAPATILWLSGDVHCSYLAQARVAGVDAHRTAVHQLTMSPFRNPLNLPIQLANRLVQRPGVARALRGLSRRAGVAEPPISWDVDDGPWFDNGMMTLVLHERAARIEVDHAWVEPTGAQGLGRTLDRSLA